MEMALGHRGSRSKPTLPNIDSFIPFYAQFFFQEPHSNGISNKKGYRITILTKWIASRLSNFEILLKSLYIGLIFILILKFLSFTL